MSQDQKYNGWTNYATWRVNLEMFDGIFDSRYPDEYEWMKDAESLKDYAEQSIEETSDKGLARDYAMAFLSEVNWHEIASHFETEWLAANLQEFDIEE